MLANSALTKINGISRLASLPLREIDPELSRLIHAEGERQRNSVSLIASENFVPRYCSDALASCLSSKYSEGYPGDRYYTGNKFIDEIETLCQKRALKAFALNSNEWGVNVQSLSGSPANFAVYSALLQPGDPILYLDLPHGGHLSHGYKTPSGKKVTATSMFYSTLPYRLNKETETIDYEELDMLADRFKPKIIVAGYSAFPRLLDYARFKEIADKHKAILHADIAHIAGLMAAKLIPSAFEHSDIVTTTTHKTLMGPRGALIFYRKKFEKQINSGVFPGCQGGPHNHTIAAVAAALKTATSPEFVEYQKQVLKNANAMGEVFKENGIRLVTGGTENHMLLLDFTEIGLKTSKLVKALEEIGIITNKNTVLTDRNAKQPHGLRLGSPAMTTRGLSESEFRSLADLVVTTTELCKEIDPLGTLPMAQFIKKFDDAMSLDNYKLRDSVIAMANSHPMILSEVWHDKTSYLVESQTELGM